MSSDPSHHLPPAALSQSSPMRRTRAATAALVSVAACCAFWIASSNATGSVVAASHLRQREPRATRWRVTAALPGAAAAAAAARRWRASASKASRDLTGRFLPPRDTALLFESRKSIGRLRLPVLVSDITIMVLLCQRSTVSTIAILSTSQN